MEKINIWIGTDDYKNLLKNYNKEDKNIYLNKYSEEQINYIENEIERINNNNFSNSYSVSECYMPLAIKEVRIIYEEMLVAKKLKNKLRKEYLNKLRNGEEITKEYRNYIKSIVLEPKISID